MIKVAPIRSCHLSPLMCCSCGYLVGMVYALGGIEPSASFVNSLLLTWVVP